MNKVITINLNGKAYQLEEAGYHLLKSYLDEAEAKLADNPDRSEIMKDFEQAIGEKCDKHLSHHKTVVDKVEIEKIIKEMGPVTGPAKSEKSEHTRETQRKLYRDPDNMIIGGVGSGLAAYLGWDVTLVRIILFVTVLAGGWGIVLYLLLWLLIPLASSSGEKLEMKGSPITFAKLEETVKEKRPEITNFLTKFFRLIGQLIRAFINLVSGIVGFFLSLGAAISAFSLTILAAILLFNPNSPYVEPSVAQIFTGSSYYVALISSYLATILPLVLLVLLGVSIMRRKNVFNPTATTALVAIWVLASAVFGSIMFRAAPQIEAAANTTYPQITKTLDLKDFETVDASGDFEVQIVPGKNYAVTLTAEEKYFDEKDVSVNNKTLFASSSDHFRICLFCFNRHAKLTVTMPALKSINGHGATDIEANGVTADQLEIKLSGASNLNISGTANDLKAVVSGASELMAGELVVKTATVKTSGASEAYLYVTEHLKAQASGASEIYYRGNPETEFESSGASEVEPAKEIPPL